MPEYIEREALRQFPIRLNHYDKEHGNEHFVLGIESVLEYAENLPKADVAEVRHGYWYRHDKKKHGDTCYYCSVCEKMALADCMVWELTDYCPHCGARMDGKGADNG